MILVTVGTNEQPFDRLVRAAASLGGSETLIVQYGSSAVEHGRGTWIDFMTFEELAAHMRDARMVVCHAGVGSIMLARHCGKTPLVLPRRVHLREAVDDHQLILARRLEEDGVLRLVEDEHELSAAIALDGTRGVGGGRDGETLPGADALTRDVRRHLERLVAA
jgi:UDP-N-acetylglucosamine transferase subunit ALG13